MVLVASVVIGISSLGGGDEVGGSDMPPTEDIGAEPIDDPSDTSVSRDISEMVIDHPESQLATRQQLEEQIATNMQANEPTYEHEVTCSETTTFEEFTHYLCYGYTIGKVSGGGTGKLEVTVNGITGEVTVEEPGY